MPTVKIYRYHRSPKIKPIIKTFRFPDEKDWAWANVNYYKDKQPYWGIFVKNDPLEASKCLHKGDLSDEQVEKIVKNLKQNLE